MSFAFLLLTSALPVVKVCLLSLVGVALAHLGVLDAKGRNSLSKCIFYCFIPSLTFTKLAASVDLTNMGRWWFLPVNVLLSIIVGMGIGWVFARVLKAPRHLQPHVICSIAAGNVGNLPLVLVAALCEDPSSMIANAVPAGKCTELGIAYVVFAMWVAGLFQFSVAYFLLKPSPEDTADKLPTVLQEQPGHLRLGRALHGAANFDVLELQPLRDYRAAASDIINPERSVQSAHAMLNMPVLSAFAGLFVGCTPFLKGLLFGPSAPFGFVKDCLEVLAAPMIPCMMMVLGAVLYKGPGSASLAPRLIVGVAFVRLLLVPLLGTLLVLGLRRAGVLVPPNALFTLVLLLGHSTPTAINVQTLATLHQNGEQEVSALLFWQYVGAIFTLPLLLTFFFHVL
ncbi:auxin efflux carrier [Coccomyxa subellipsoidea C-169]|uniref:Auxin efflux carrier n=1 Tax=Coccomyxa subellipsoidea (strain C-169) TaxID=574566 RepID=I0Z978_COCSC|nr:auxin efflux carrier [Coccomyxa subellipsoidea C-169]EIE27197.1 auxin efflux carrier [Coccomyxa subellipsoidea C-169]|eukprot:XP_005651741.1 auxin efflux carrier [Coccomyxa subellipsoidea C-169]